MFAARRRLSVPARSKGCILLCSFTEKFEEIRSLLVVRKLIRISVPMFWPGSCPTNFHKTTEIPIAVLRRINIRTIIYGVCTTCF